MREFRGETGRKVSDKPGFVMILYITHCCSIQIPISCHLDSSPHTYIHERIYKLNRTLDLFRIPDNDYLPYTMAEAQAQEGHTYKFNVSMSCGGCSGAVNRVLGKLEGA